MKERGIQKKANRFKGAAKKPKKLNRDTGYARTVSKSEPSAFETATTNTNVSDATAANVSQENAILGSDKVKQGASFIAPVAPENDRVPTGFNQGEGLQDDVDLPDSSPTTVLPVQTMASSSLKS